MRLRQNGNMSEKGRNMSEKVIREARSRAITDKDRADFARYEGMFVSRKPADSATLPETGDKKPVARKKEQRAADTGLKARKSV